jgi:diaminopimelate decarboxylase
VYPVTAQTNALGHLTIGNVDVIELAEQYGTPLWLIDEATIKQAVLACRQGLANYPNSQILYAGKAFLCMAMCSLIDSLELGLDVVSHGELYTALKAGFPANKIYLHGNNKSALEIEEALKAGDVKIVLDSFSEIELTSQIARNLGKKAKVLLRLTPGIEPDTHHYIQTGQKNSKFGIDIEDSLTASKLIHENNDALTLVGLHAHIGSQSQELDPYLEIVSLMADAYATIKNNLGIVLEELDLGGGLGISYTANDSPIAIYDWAYALAERVKICFEGRNLALPKLLLEPGRSIVGTAGVTLYKAGHMKKTNDGINYLALDGGMADNPRPVTYQALYHAEIANRMNAPTGEHSLTLVGKFCESGDIIIKDTNLPATPGDYIAVFATGAYNYSMASNYNRTARPACLLISEGEAEVIIERETNEILTQQDRIPERLYKQNIKHSLI